MYRRNGWWWGVLWGRGFIVVVVIIIVPETILVDAFEAVREKRKRDMFCTAYQSTGVTDHTYCSRSMSSGARADDRLAAGFSSSWLWLFRPPLSPPPTPLLDCNQAVSLWRQGTRFSLRTIRLSARAAKRRRQRLARIEMITVQRVEDEVSQRRTSPATSTIRSGFFTRKENLSRWAVVRLSAGVSTKYSEPTLRIVKSDSGGTISVEKGGEKRY